MSSAKIPSVMDLRKDFQKMIIQFVNKTRVKPHEKTIEGTFIMMFMDRMHDDYIDAYTTDLGRAIPDMSKIDSYNSQIKFFTETINELTCDWYKRKAILDIEEIAHDFRWKKWSPRWAPIVLKAQPWAKFPNTSVGFWIDQRKEKLKQKIVDFEDCLQIAATAPTMKVKMMTQKTVKDFTNFYQKIIDGMFKKYAEQIVKKEQAKKAKKEARKEYEQLKPLKGKIPSEEYLKRVKGIFSKPGMESKREELEKRLEERKIMRERKKAAEIQKHKDYYKKKFKQEVLSLERKYKLGPISTYTKQWVTEYIRLLIKYRKAFDTGEFLKEERWAREMAKQGEQQKRLSRIKRKLRDPNYKRREFWKKRGILDSLRRKKHEIHPTDIQNLIS